MLSMIILLIAIGLLTIAFVRWATLNNGYFAKRGMAHLQPTIFFGNTGGFFLKQHRANEYFDWLYKQFPNEK